MTNLERQKFEDAGLNGYSDEVLEVMQAAIDNDNTPYEDIADIFIASDPTAEETAEIILGYESGLSKETCHHLAQMTNKGFGYGMDIEQMKVLRDAYLHGLTEDVLLNEGFYNSNSDVNELRNKIYDLNSPKIEHVSLTEIDKEDQAFDTALKDEIKDLENEKKLSDLEKETIPEENISSYNEAIANLAKEEEAAAKAEFEKNSEKYYKVVVNAQGQFEYAEAAIADTLQQQVFEKENLDRNILEAEQTNINNINMTPEEFAEQCPFGSTEYYNHLEYLYNDGFYDPTVKKLKENNFTFLVPEDYAKSHSAKTTFINKLKEIESINGGLPDDTRSLSSAYIQSLVDVNTPVKQNFKTAIRVPKTFASFIKDLGSKVKDKLINIIPANNALKAKEELINQLVNAGNIAQEVGDAYKAEFKAAKEHHVFAYREAKERKELALNAFSKAFEKIRDVKVKTVEKIKSVVPDKKPQQVLNKYINNVNRNFEKAWKDQAKLFKERGMNEKGLALKKEEAREQFFNNPEIAQNIKDFRLQIVENNNMRLKLDIDAMKIKEARESDRAETKVNEISFDLDEQKEKERDFILKTKSSYLRSYNKERKAEEKSFDKAFAKLNKDYSKACKLGENSPAAVMVKKEIERLERNHNTNLTSIENTYKRKLDSIDIGLNNLDKKYDKLFEQQKELAYGDLEDLRNKIHSAEIQYDNFDSYYNNLKECEPKDFVQDSLNQVSYIDYMAYTDKMYDNYIDVNGNQVPREGIEVSAKAIQGHEQDINDILNQYTGHENIKTFITNDKNDRPILKFAALNAEDAVELKNGLIERGIDFNAKANPIMEKMQTEVVRATEKIWDAGTRQDDAR